MHITPSSPLIEEIWTGHRLPLLQFISRRVETADVAEDILQSIFVRIHGRAGTSPPRENLSAWLYRVARNAIVDHYRTRKVFRSIPEDLPAPPDLTSLEGRELSRCIRPMVDRLPEEYRAVVAMADLDGWPLKEVAVKLGLSLPATKSRVQRGRRMLLRRFLDCCKFEVDVRGKPLSWTKNSACFETLCCD